MVKRALFSVVAVLALAGLGGCKVKSFENKTLRTHEALHQRVCSEAGGFVQVNIDGCSPAGFSFYGELSVTPKGSPGASYLESKVLRDAGQARFDRRLGAGDCATVSIINMDDGASATCNFHVYWDL
ncbi:MAG: hypothetical protein R3A78_03980 [Polyangiales bacterium]